MTVAIGILILGVVFTIGYCVGCVDERNRWGKDIKEGRVKVVGCARGDG